MRFQLAVSFHDGSALPEERLRYDRMLVRPTVQFRSAASRVLETRVVKQLPDRPGVWEVNIDLRSELATGANIGTGDKRIKDLVNDVSALRLVADYKDGYGAEARAELLALTQFSIGDKHIKVLTSTRRPKVNNASKFTLSNLTPQARI